jgi:RNA polymerase sigma factor (sigma-70 family)
VSDENVLTAQFEQHRPRLRAMAYRMLGSANEADDAVQEAWLRLNRADGDAVANLGGWLTTVVGRIVLDMLRARSARREETFGEGIPEQIISVDAIDTGGDPAEQVELADSVGLALLVVLETLAPAERLAFVLHDMFGVSFDEIAPIVERSPTAARQLASRARRRVRGAELEPEPDPPRQREIVAAFLAASRAGDFEALLEVLDPDVVFRIDARGRTALAREPITGAADVAREVLARGTPFAPLARQATVDGRAGAVVARPGQDPFAAVSFTVRDGRIARIDLVLDLDRRPPSPPPPPPL